MTFSFEFFHSVFCCGNMMTVFWIWVVGSKEMCVHYIFIRFFFLSKKEKRKEKKRKNKNKGIITFWYLFTKAMIQITLLKSEFGGCDSLSTILCNPQDTSTWKTSVCVCIFTMTSIVNRSTFCELVAYFFKNWNVLCGAVHNLHEKFT